MELTKREFFALSGSAAAFAALGCMSSEAVAATDEVKKLISEFSGGKTPASGKIALTTPEIAENGNTVPVSFEVESPMTKDSHVSSVMLLATGNPRPGVATFHFSALSGQATATTRIRLAKTQDVIAVAKMSDGSVFMDRKQVKVTIGGCGG